MSTKDITKSRAQYFKDVATSEGFQVVNQPQYDGHEGPFPQLHYADIERDWPMGDWEGAARDIGWPFDDTPDTEVAAFDQAPEQAALTALSASRECGHLHCMAEREEQQRDATDAALATLINQARAYLEICDTGQPADEEFARQIDEAEAEL